MYILSKTVDGENKIIYDFDQCGTKEPSVTFQHIEYTGTLYHAADENNDAASGRLYTFNPDFDYKFTCKIARSLTAASNSVGGNIVGAEISVNIPEDTAGVIKFKPPDQDFTILLPPDAYGSNNPDIIPVVASLSEADTINVNVSHVVSIVLPLQPEWWLQLADLTGSEEEMETEICDTIDRNWNLTNKDSHIENCNITLLEKIVIDSDARKFNTLLIIFYGFCQKPVSQSKLGKIFGIIMLIIALIEQFPDLNQTLLDKYEKKIKLNFQKRKLERQANDAADYSYVFGISIISLFEFQGWVGRSSIVGGCKYNNST